MAEGEVCLPVVVVALPLIGPLSSRKGYQLKLTYTATTGEFAFLCLSYNFADDDSEVPLAISFNAMFSS